MNEFPLVSVVTPARNSELYIAETIESVRSQDYPNLEHIVIDGASTDRTLEILQGYPQVSWISEADSGQSEALNKGFRKAKGEIIGWLNADDTYQPGAVSTAVRYLQENPEIDLVYSDVRVVDETGEFVGISRSQPFDLWTLVQTSFIKQPTVFMRRRVLMQLGGVDEALHYVMDWELWLRAGMAGFKLLYLDGQLPANFRICQGTKSYESVPKFQLEWYQVLERRLYDPIFDQKPAPAKLRIIKKFKSGFFLAESFQAINEKDLRKMLSYLSKAVKADARVMLNRGVWYKIGMGFFGRSVDWRRKYWRDHV